MTDRELSLRIMLVEDHPLYRRGLRTVLSGEPGFTVAGEAADGYEAVRLAMELCPDVILMDLHLPGQSGLAATREIVTAHPDIRILVVSLLRDDDTIFAALRAGARGYILKEASERDVIRAIRATAAGESLFSPEIANRVLAWFAQVRPTAPKAFPDLTDRERDILHLIASGKNNLTIANELSLSVKTVANHVSNIFGKLHVSDRAEAIVRARDAGLGRTIS
ncbi:MAG: response regulator transcription factor [Thermomicrobiales bacterium]